MSLKIATPSGTFDLPSDFDIEIEDTSPIYNERGSQSVAATLPASKNNLRLVNHIHRLDTDQAPVENARVTVSDGIYLRSGKMNITQASHTGGIVSNVGFDESEIYNIWNAINLRALKDLPVYKSDNGAEGLITYLEDIMLDRRTDTPFHVFPICVAMPSNNENDTTKYYPEYLNSMTESNDTYHLNGAARTEIYLIDGKAVTTSLPTGYGITPFLKITWLLEYIFTYYGYKVVENPFATHPQLSRMVVLNNTADCCVKGNINYSDLMPDCTINELFQALYCRFGMVYFVDGKTKTIRLKFMKDIISAPASQDWTLLKSATPVINYEARQQLKLSAATSISGPYQNLVAAPAAESLDKFLAPYDYIVSDNIYGDGYLCHNMWDGYYSVRNIFNGQLETVSSDFFNWDKGANIDYQEISSIDECLPIKSNYPDDEPCCPAYLLGKVHRYTNISSSDVELSENQETQSPLCFCFSMPVSSTVYPYGTPRCIGPTGTNVVDGNSHTFDISITFVGENGLFNRFWKDYDAILRHANHTVEVPLHLSIKQLLNADFSQTVKMDGQRMLIDLQRYQLPLHLSSPTTVKLRSLKLLKPYDLDKEQNIEIIKQLYKWNFVNNRESVVNSVIAEQVRKWKDGLASTATWLGTNRKNEVSDNVSSAEIPYTVPTQEDYDTQHTYYVKKVKYSFDLYYKIRVIKSYTSQGVPIYEDKEYGGVHYEVEYNLWVQAMLL